MIVDIQDGFVKILDYQGKLESYHIHQLNFWGFESSIPYNALISTQSPSRLLLKLIEYFDSE